MRLAALLTGRGETVCAVWDALVAGRRLLRGRLAWCAANSEHPQYGERTARMRKDTQEQVRQEHVFAKQSGCPPQELHALLTWAASLTEDYARVPSGCHFVGTRAPGAPAQARGGDPAVLPPAMPPVTEGRMLPPVLESLAAVRGVGLDLETVGLDPRAGRIRLLTVATGNGAWTIDCDRVDPRPVLTALAGKLLIGHHLQFDLGWLRHHFAFEPRGPVVDTILLARLLSASGGYLPRGYHGLDQVARRALGIDLPKEEQQRDWRGELVRAQWDYALRDAQVLLPLASRLTDQIRAAGMTEVARIECACLPGVVWMAGVGVPVDVPAWKGLAAAAAAEIHQLEAALAAAAPPRGGLDLGAEFSGWNWRSPQEVADCFRRLGIELASTADEVLAGIDHPVADLLRRHRAASKLVGTYGEGWLAKGSELAGRIYPDWNQLESRAGRMSCSGPNLQQIPRDPRYRECFRAPEGRVLVKADYANIEMRIAAKLAGDAVMLQAYRAGADIHTLTARRLLGREEVTKADRQIAKSANFGLLYGMGAAGLRDYARATYGVELTEEEAVRHRDAWLQLYSGIARWHRTQPEGAIETRTLAGRRRRDVDRFTQKLNSPVQGCLQARCRVLTEQGYRAIGDLYRDGPTRQVWTGTEWAAYQVVNRGPCRLAAVVLSHGVRLPCDTRHELLKITPEGYRWCSFADLLPGDRLAVSLARPLELPGAPLPPIPHGLRSTLEPVLPAEVEELWFWLGYYMGCGWIDQRQRSLVYAFGIHKQKVAQRCAEFWAGFGVHPKLREKPAQPEANRRERVTVEVYSVDLARWLGDLGFPPSTAHSKRLPVRVFGETLAHRKAFVRGFLAADGSLTDSTGAGPSLHLCQRPLVEDMQLLLRTVGVESQVRGPYQQGEFTSFRLNIFHRMLQTEVYDLPGIWPRFRGMDTPEFLVAELRQRYAGTPQGAFPSNSAYTLFRRMLNGGTTSVYTFARLAGEMGWEFSHPIYAERQVVRTEIEPAIEDTYTLAVEHPAHRFDSEGVISKNTGADGLKRALALLWARRSRCPGAVPVLACHDELVVECAADQAEDAAAWLRQAMLDGMTPLLAAEPHPVPVEVEIKVGATWAG